MVNNLDNRASCAKVSFNGLLTSRPAALLYFFILWFSLLCLSGSIFSGFHFTDDHELLAIGKDISESSLSVTMVKWIKSDSTFRFRPIYYVHRILGVYFFGQNYLLWSIYAGILAVLSTFILFLFSLQTGFSFSQSVLFALLTLLGAQAAVFWRLGPNETIGVFFMSLTLYFLAKSMKSAQKLFYFAFLTCLFLMTLSKESFIILVPAIVLWKLWLNVDIKGISWKESLKGDRSLMFVSLFIVSTELLLIKLHVNTKGLGYAGVEDIGLISFFRACLALFNFGYLGPIIAAIFISILLNDCRSIRQGMKRLILPLMLFGAIILPQIVLYAKSGIFERYFLPAILGNVFLLVYLLKNLPGFNTDRKISWFKLVWFWLPGIVLLATTLAFALFDEFGQALLSKISALTGKSVTQHWLQELRELFIGISLVGAALLAIPVLLIKGRRSFSFAIWFFLVLAILNSGKIAWSNARAFAEEGFATNQALSYLLNNIDKESRILIAGDPAYNYEWAFSLKRYLNYHGGYRNLHVASYISGSHYTEFERSLIDGFKSGVEGNTLDNILDKEKIENIVVFREAEKAFVKGSKDWFNPEKYLKNDFNVVSIYIKKS